MDAQRIAVDAVVELTDCDREAVVAFIRKLYLSGVKDPKRLTFKGLQAMARNGAVLAGTSSYSNFKQPTQFRF